ncbi:NCS1 family nucleobase:cation symporter-1 [Noviherbaspirillum sp. Root189]|uniref:NCS1 family nucleobase:cation symporter-1 n=1 Tax=Noviherbaspirillum sp. Root189 TaxID=1736487 RepID=UPI00070B72FB|nr:NCS1 family nucleobase:cation symporter-1 [Noviherbaspirillum sp. Root189]KRB89918.1 nitrate reductase [Noviherbaspirillum sp. Root189]
MTQNNNDNPLWNEDLAPTTDAQRTWTATHYAALWVSMAVSVPAYMLASGLMSEGMNWWQAVLTVFLGNVIVLIPMVLVGHAGAKHGIPYPVLARTSFGVRGAQLPAILRAVVACGWFGIQTWLGGQAIYTILNLVMNNALQGSALPGLGINAGQLGCFLLFWALHIYFIAKGTDSIRWMETAAAPLLLLSALGLVWWAYSKAGGFGPMVSTPSQFVEGGKKAGQFWTVFWPSLTAMVGYWATLALNIPDFTRFARSQRDQMVGQAIGLPIPMGLLALVAVLVTSATVAIYGEAIWDPVALTGKMGGISVVIALIALIIATITTNLAANVVSPAYDFSNLAPRRISFKMGGYITAGIGLAMFPWKILETTQGYIFTWLIGYGALLGPIAGIMLVDYFLIRRTRLNHADLFTEHGEYGYSNGWNLRAVVALVLGVLPNLPGFLKAAGFISSTLPVFETLYTYAWFVGLAISAVVYALLMPRKTT